MFTVAAAAISTLENKVIGAGASESITQTKTAPATSNQTERELQGLQGKTASVKMFDCLPVHKCT
eukprot:1141063-Pelagomonas_calceolata.AAC.1